MISLYKYPYYTINTGEFDMSHKLLIKTHKVTGMKYLCYTQKIDHEAYLGSGKYWIRHLEKYGNDIETELVFITEDYEKFVQTAIQKSIELNVVLSDSWANLRLEDGVGGNTVSNKMWITDETDEMYIEKESHIPTGWHRGRSKLKCKFTDIHFQREMSSRSDRVKAGESIKKAWAEGRVKRDNSKCGTRGLNNPSKRLEVREKISAWHKQKAQEEVICPHCGKKGKQGVGMRTKHFDKCRFK